MNRIFTMLMVVFPAFAAAQTPMTLSDCLRTALERNLILRSGQIAVLRAEDLQKTSFDLAPTELSFGQDFTTGLSTDNSVRISQTFDLPSVYSSKSKLLKAQTDVERGRMAVTRNQLAANVKSAYFTLAFMRERLRILQSQDSLYTHFLQIANDKLGAGETGRLEQMNIERLAGENRTAVANAARNVHTAQLQLMLWMNTDSAVTTVGDTLQRLDIGNPGTFDAASTPMGAALQNEVTAADRNLHSIKQGWMPQVSIGATIQAVIRGLNPYNVDRTPFSKGDLMGLEVGVSLPLSFGAQSAKVRAAKREVDMAELNRQEQLRSLQTDYQTAMDSYAKARCTLDYYDREALHKSDEMVRISHTAYKNGSISYVELLQNMQTAEETRMSYVQAINDFNQAIIRLESIRGSE